MNDEIREILEHIKLYPEKIYCLSEKEKIIILDYITNLQQENERANQYIYFYKDLVNKQSKRNSRQRLANQKQQELILKLQQENERLKEENNNKAMNDYAHAIDESWYRELYDDYKSRCEKASEFIKEKISSTKGVINDYMYHKEHNKHLIELLNEDIEMYKKELNILQNGDENNV